MQRVLPAFVGFPVRRVLAASGCVLLIAITTAHGSPIRRTPVVEAVSAARPAIVNIHGEKTIADQSNLVEGSRRVNGMGTGVIIDERGYIITNHHVIEGVRQIQVTLSDQRSFPAKLIARDAQTDLAVIKINAGQPLPLIRVGTSGDLMLGETVIAVGNAYGYHNTVTQGIVSALNRSVEVTDAQKYHDLIQTDASINPGNSGGPLLNLDGEMIGINVAVRVGAQGIGFAIPVDKVMEVTASMISAERLSGTWHGVVGYADISGGEVRYIVERVATGSPADQAGIQYGDVISAINHTPVQRQLDIERALLGLKPGSDVSVSVRRSNGQHQLAMQLASAQQAGASQTADATTQAQASRDIWRKLGVRATPVPGEALGDARSKFRAGLRVTAVRPNSVAERSGIRPGDILCGVHIWETVSLSNLEYVLNRPELSANETVKFFIVRDSVARLGDLPVTWR